MLQEKDSHEGPASLLFYGSLFGEFAPYTGEVNGIIKIEQEPAISASGFLLHNILRVMRPNAAHLYVCQLYNLKSNLDAVFSSVQLLLDHCQRTGEQAP